MIPRVYFKYILTIFGLFGVTLLTKLFQELFQGQVVRADLDVFEGQPHRPVHLDRLRRFKEPEQLIKRPSDDPDNIYDRHEMHQKLSDRLREIKHHKSANQVTASGELPTIFVITPTYRRFLQKAELTRVSQTFRHVKNLHWILVEDAYEKTNPVKRLLAESGLRYTHLNARTPKGMRIVRGQPHFTKSRGIEQRNMALDWLRRSINPNVTKGVVYFADDDNTYDVRLFREMRDVKTVGVWPVAFTGAARWAGPVCRQGKVVGFHSNWKPERPFPIDMAAFAINIRKLLIEKPTARFEPDVKPGFLETSFLEQITTRDELEAKAGNCLKVYVWHTRSEVPWINISGERQLIKRGKPSNRDVET